MLRNLEIEQTLEGEKMPSDNKDWKDWKSGWRYRTDAPRNKEWKKDREKLFRENGNGWWYYQGYHIWKDSARR